MECSTSRISLTATVHVRRATSKSLAYSLFCSPLECAALSGGFGRAEYSFCERLTIHVQCCIPLVMDDNLLSVGDAADYLGISIQTLRRWDASGKLKSLRNPGSNYRCYRLVDLEPFRTALLAVPADNPDIGKLFQTTPFNIESNVLLRDPQKEAHEHVREHFARSNDPVIVQIPVGCGKTGVIATVPFGIASGRVLVILPNLTILKGVSAALDVTNPKCFWRTTKVLKSFSNGPYRAVLNGRNANIHDCIRSHFVVTNIQQLASSADRWLPQFPERFFDMILVDEGHHNVADSWRKVSHGFRTRRCSA